MGLGLGFGWWVVSGAAVPPYKKGRSLPKILFPPHNLLPLNIRAQEASCCFLAAWLSMESNRLVFPTN